MGSNASSSEGPGFKSRSYYWSSCLKYFMLFLRTYSNVKSRDISGGMTMSYGLDDRGGISGKDTILLVALYAIVRYLQILFLR
jgi:hypothetical protein